MWSSALPFASSTTFDGRWDLDAGLDGHFFPDEMFVLRHIEALQGTEVAVEVRCMFCGTSWFSVCTQCLRVGSLSERETLGSIVSAGIHVMGGLVEKPFLEVASSRANSFIFLVYITEVAEVSETSPRGRSLVVHVMSILSLSPPSLSTLGALWHLSQVLKVSCDSCLSLASLSSSEGVL